jgi:hypothetical protein
MPKKRIPPIKLEPPYTTDSLQVIAFILESLASDLDNKNVNVKAGYIGSSIINARNVTVQRVIRSLAYVLYRMAGVNVKK